MAQRSHLSDYAELSRVNVPVRDRRAGQLFNLRIEVCRSSTLQSASRRVTFFTCLIDEHNIVDLPRNGKGTLLIN